MLLAARCIFKCSLRSPTLLSCALAFCSVSGIYLSSEQGPYRCSRKSPTIHFLSLSFSGYAMWVSLAAASADLLSSCGAWASHCGDYSCCRARAQSVWRHGLSCPTAWGILLDQGPNLCSPRWHGHALPLDHQGSPQQSVLEVGVGNEFAAVANFGGVNIPTMTDFKLRCHGRKKYTQCMQASASHHWPPRHPHVFILV